MLCSLRGWAEVGVRVSAPCEGCGRGSLGPGAARHMLRQQQQAPDPISSAGGTDLCGGGPPRLPPQWVTNAEQDRTECDEVERNRLDPMLWT